MYLTSLTHSNRALVKKPRYLPVSGREPGSYQKSHPFSLKTPHFETKKYGCFISQIRCAWPKVMKKKLTANNDFKYGGTFDFKYGRKQEVDDEKEGKVILIEEYDDKSFVPFQQEAEAAEMEEVLKKIIHN
ncbi:hypothetical protein AVEN_237789-1 [Araneus ventricosus]|uniref:Uncharacterized protein n=1 Tax=Araneus ventricosus TaxID=182803 RepID=A0A4Y2GZJ8_ARAVE|nr:hypothetical protein AVEN_237789-1 [Araneus ventricosus]